MQTISFHRKPQRGKNTNIAHRRVWDHRNTASWDFIHRTTASKERQHRNTANPHEVSMSLSDLFITSMITDRIGRHEVLLPTTHKN